MRVLVTGGAGFIGTNLVQMLLSQTEHSVINLDKLTYAANTGQLHKFCQNDRFQFHQLDLSCCDDLARIIYDERPDWLIHLAAESHVDRSIASPDEFIQTNILGTYRLLEATRDYLTKCDAKTAKQFRLIHMSTDEVFGSLEIGAKPFDADASYAPNSPYSASKAAADQLVRAWHQTFGMPITTIHCGNNYGPFQFPEKLIPVVIQSCLNENPIPVYGQGKNIRDWIHVDDHCRAILAIANKGRNGQNYLVGSRCEVSNIKLVKSICRIIDQLKPRPNGSSYLDLIEHVADRPAHDFRYAVDPARTEKETGWAAEIQFDDGLESTVRWYLERQKQTDSPGGKHSSKTVNPVDPLPNSSSSSPANH